MKRNIATIGIIIILLIVSFTGCTQTVSEDTQYFIDNIPDMDENLRISLTNINTHLNNYDTEYKWSILMNYLTITSSMLSNMENYQESINDELSYIDALILDYNSAKEKANLDQLDNEETTQMNNINDMILDYNMNKDKVDYCLSNMSIYQEYLTLVVQKLTLLEDYESHSLLLNNRVEDEEYEKAINTTDTIVDLFNQLKPIAFQMSNLSILDYSEEILGIWDMYIESWQLYKEHLELTIEGKYNQAEIKYNEYAEIFDDILVIENTDNINEGNNEIDYWYTTHIGSYLGLFEDI